MNSIIPKFYSDQYNNLIDKSNEKDLIISHIGSNLPKKSNISLLEIGSGTQAIFYKRLKTKVFSYTIIEKEISKSIKTEECIVHIEDDFETNDLKNKYDVILASHVLYYFKDKRLAIEKMISLLKDDGKIFFVTNTYENDYKKIKDFFFNLINKEYEPTQSTLIKILNDTSYKKDELKFMSEISYSNAEELYEILKLSFDQYPKEYLRYKKEIINFLKKIRRNFQIIQTITILSKENDWSNLIRHNDYSLSVDDLHIEVKDKVFTPDPKVTFSTSMILNNFPNVEDKNILDVGTGTGILAIKASKNRAKSITAIDISPEAIINAELNIKNNNIDNIELHLGNLAFNLDKKFEYIFANLPIKDELWEISSGDLVEEFLVSISNNIDENTEVYIPWGSFANDKIKIIENIFRKYGWKYNRKEEKNMNTTWYLYILKKN